MDGRATLARTMNKFVLPASLAAITVLLTALFEFGVRPPVVFSIVVSVASLVLVLLYLRTPWFPILPLYVLGLYALPFINLVDHAIHPPEYFLSQAFIWGLAANDYQRDPTIVEATGLVGAIGALALATGMFLAAALLGRTPEVPATRWRLAAPSFVLLAIAAIVLAWMRAPSASIFEVAYTKGVSPLESCGINFNAPIMVAAIFIGAAAIDVLSERGTALIFKGAVAGVAIALVVFWYGFLHGLREAIAIIPAIFILATCEPRFTQALRRPAVWAGVIIAGVLVVLAGQIIGSVRADVAAGPSTARVEICPATALIGALNRVDPALSLPTPSAVVVSDPAVPVGGTPSPVSQAENPTVSSPNAFERLVNKGLNLGTGTWSAVLLSPLSVVGDAERGLLTPRMGATYVDYILSLPPSFIAQALHYERPIEPTHGPAWEVRYGIGGTHLLVVPFVNFRAPGVALILALFGGLIVASEVAARRRPTWGRMLWYAAVLIAAPRWIWYGDLYLVRAAMAFAVILLIVWLLPKARRTTLSPSEKSTADVVT